MNLFDITVTMVHVGVVEEAAEYLIFLVCGVLGEMRKRSGPAK